MAKIILPKNLITTEQSKSKLNPYIDFETWRKTLNAVSDPNNEYVLTISPKNDKHIKKSELQPRTFNYLNIKGDLTLNIENIDFFSIFFNSEFHRTNINNYRYDHPWHKGYHEYLNYNDYLFSKNLTINAKNLYLSINVEYDEDAFYELSHMYSNNLLPLEKLIINCNEANVHIKNQNIKEIYINAKNIHESTLIFYNLPELEYLDISCYERLDLERFPMSDEEIEELAVNFYNQPNEVNPAKMNYFNVQSINKNCKIKLNSNICFWFKSKRVLTTCTAYKAIPADCFEQENINFNWRYIQLSKLIDCKNKKFIEITWKNLQIKLLNKINEIISSETYNETKILSSKLNKNK